MPDLLAAGGVAPEADREWRTRAEDSDDLRERLVEILVGHVQEGAHRPARVEGRVLERKVQHRGDLCVQAERAARLDAGGREIDAGVVESGVGDRLSVAPGTTADLEDGPAVLTLQSLEVRRTPGDPRVGEIPAGAGLDLVVVVRDQVALALCPPIVRHGLIVGGSGSGFD